MRTKKHMNKHVSKARVQADGVYKEHLTIKNKGSLWFHCSFLPLPPLIAIIMSSRLDNVRLDLSVAVC